jgi:thiol:disulfide interchange protein DsbC
MRSSFTRGSKPIFRICAALLLASLALVGGGSAAQGDPDVEAAKASLRKAYPNFVPDEVRKTDLDGVYEVVGDGNVAYFHPKTGTLILGNMVRGGKSLTQERRNEILSKFLKSLPVEKSIRVGKGIKEVIEFSDPDCPYCRKAAEYLSKRKDVTRRVFLFPLSIHKEARKKSLKILCSADAGAAYSDAMVGKLDAEFSLPEGCEARESALLDEHLSWGKKLGVNGTPAFWVKGERVEGADLQRLEQLLADKK